MEAIAAPEIDRLLERSGYGFLGLARDDRPYVIPMSFGYDGDVYLQMNDVGRKYDFLDGRTPACLTVFEYDPETGRSTSVVVEGPLRPVTAAEERTALAVLADNARFGTDLSLWGVPIQSADPRLFVLEPDAATGRRFGEGVPHDSDAD